MQIVANECLKHTHTLHTFTDKLFKKLKPKHLKQNTLKQTSADLNNACCVCLNIRLNFFFQAEIEQMLYKVCLLFDNKTWIMVCYLS